MIGAADMQHVVIASRTGSYHRARSPQCPDLPSVAETLPGYEVDNR